MKQRILTFLIISPPILFLILQSNFYLFAGLIFLASSILIYEVIKMSHKNRYKYHLVITLCFNFIFYLINILEHQNHLNIAIEKHLFYIFILFLYLFFISSYHLFSKNFSQNDLVKIGTSLFAFVYFGFIFSYILQLKEYNGDYRLGNLYILYTLIVCWSYDSGAYFIGSALGGKKIPLSVSPNKTLSGLLGGILASLLANALYLFILKVTSPIFYSEFLLSENYGYSYLITFCLAVIAQWGDLIESIFKRSSEVKDSSKLLPGHGGLFDVMDSSIPSLFLIYVALKILDKGLLF